MTLQDQIGQDIKEAMKAKDTDKLSTLRLLKSALKNKQIDLMREITQEEVEQVIKTQMKQLQDALSIYEDAGRHESAEQARQELTVFERYLPEQLGDEELEVIVKKAVESSGVSSKEEMGKAMGVAMKDVAGRADGSRVREIVQRLIATFVFALGGVSLFVGTAHAALDPMSEEFIISAMRIARMFLLVLGIVFVVFLIMGGFTYIISSGRNETQMAATKKVVIGIVGTIVVAVLFSVLSVVLAGK